MKRFLLFLMLFSLTIAGFAQTTYYWAGGTTASSLSGTNWSTTLGGAATTARSAPDDILVFDNTTVVFDITSTTIGKLVIQNGADITFNRSLSSTGTSTLTLAGVGGIGLEVNNAKLRVNGSTVGYNTTIALGAGVTGAISNSAEVFITGTANNRISATTTGVLTFQSGTTCTVNSAVNPFNTYTSGTNDNSVFFDSGATLIFQGGLSPFGNTTSGNILKLAPISNFIFQAVHPTNLFSSRIFGNVLIKSGLNISLGSENFIKINNLTIESGSTFNLRTSGGHAIAGNILVDGSLGVNGTPTSSQLIMVGTSPQTISGSGTINTLGCFSVAKDGDVSLSKNLVINGTSTSNILGRLNFGTSVISGTCNVQFRGAATLSDNGGSTISGSNTIQMTNLASYNALSPTVGLLVTGAGIPANSYIIGTSSGSFNFTISNFATATASNVAITTIGDAATLSTSNTAGPDASLITTGNGTATKSIGSGTNLIINAATVAPFATTFFTSAGTQTNISYGNVTFNAASTTNADAIISGALTLNNTKLTIRPGGNLTMSATSSFAGNSNTAYVVTDANTSTGAIGTLKLAGVTTSKLVPVGSASNYLPVTLSPTTASDFSINVFQGATVDATANGTALAAGQKADIVDAIYNISRTAGTGNCDVTLGWQAGLEGSNFSGLSDANVGIAKYTGGAFTSFVGPGNNTSNTITISITDDVFGPFLVGKVGVLPVTLISFNAKASNQTIVLKWKATSEVNLSHYLVQRSTDGVSFETLSSVKANNTSGIFDYGFIDQSPSLGANYYQLVSVDIDGKTSTSNLQVVNLGSVITLAVYPNPTSGTINISGLNKGDIVKVADLVGKILKVEQSKDASAMSLNIDNSTSGIYSVSVLRNGKIISSNKIIKN